MGLKRLIVTYSIESFSKYIIMLEIKKKLKEQLDKHIKLKDKKKTALHEFSSSYETSSGIFILC